MCGMVEKVQLAAILQGKNEETRHHFPNGTLLPGEMLLSENVIQTLPILCNLPKMLLGY